MFGVDALSAFVICGAGSLIAAAMLQTVDSEEPSIAGALRLCQRGLILLGAGLFPLLAMSDGPGPTAQVLMSAATLISILLLVFGLGRLLEQTFPLWLMVTLVVLAGVVPMVGQAVGPSGLAKALALGLFGTSVMMVLVVRRTLLKPQSKVDLGLAVAVMALALSCLIRLVLTLDYAGPPLQHLLHMPPAWIAVFAVLYGVMPFLVSTLMLVMVNARLRQQLQRRASTDELTGLLARRALRELAGGVIESAQRGRLQVAVLMFDLDHFKSVNDGLGHAVGDLVLRHAAQIMARQLRADAMLARYGGEEFVALVPVEDLRTAHLVAERVRAAIAQAPWAELALAELCVTVSIGVTLMVGVETLDDGLKRADAAMYRAKREGRNQVQVGLRAA